MNATITPKYWTNIELPYNIDIFWWLLQWTLYINNKNVFVSVWTIFSSFIAPELIIIENSGWGNRIYLFVAENFHLQVDLLRNRLYTYIEHKIIITNMFGMLKENSFIVIQLIS